MSLAMLLYPPPTRNGLQEHFFHHYQSHLAIVQGVKLKLGVPLTVYDIWPVDPSNKPNIEDWKEAHQSLHTDFETLLNIQGVDLSEVSFDDKKSMDSFMYANWQSHYAAYTSLGLTT
jgi:hypothetical protein